MAIQLGYLAERIGADLHGDPKTLIVQLAPLDAAQAGDITFLYDRCYRRFLDITQASAVILAPVDLKACPAAALVVEDPYLGYVRATALLRPPRRMEPGIHPSACIGPGAEIDASAYVGPHAVVGEGVGVGAHASIGPGCILEHSIRVGDYTWLVSHVTVLQSTLIGR